MIVQATFARLGRLVHKTRLGPGKRVTGEVGARIELVR